MSFVEMLLPRFFSMEYFQTVPPRQLSLSPHLLSAMHACKGCELQANCNPGCPIRIRMFCSEPDFERLSSGPFQLVGFGGSVWSDPDSQSFGSGFLIGLIRFPDWWDPVFPIGGIRFYSDIKSFFYNIILIQIY